MAWKVTIAGKSLLLDDFSIDEFTEIAIAHPEVSWLRLYTSPASHPGAFYDLLNACARKLEVPSPERPATVKQAAALLSYLEPADDDLPKAFTDGAIPLEAPEEKETITSSTSTGPEDGPPSKPARRR